MTTRQIGRFLWNAKGPADYELLGYGNIQTYFNGKKWYIRGVDIPFDSMIQLSQVLGLVCNKYEQKEQG